MERLIGVDELQPGEHRSVYVDDFPALVARVADDYFVIEDVCSHDGQPLTDGTITEGAITCPRHGARFDLKTGDALCMPATKGIKTFAVEIKDGAVWGGLQSAARSEAPSAVKSTVPTTAPVVRASTEMPADSGASASAGADAATGLIVEDSGPSTESDFLEALRQVIDPELMINIVDLGLIYSVEVDEEKSGRVKVDMTLTSPACPAGPQLVQQSKMSLERLHDVDEAAITLVMSPPWTPERMTDDARDQLGIF